MTTSSVINHTKADTEQALPPEVSIQSDTWLNRYRNYPVFSRTWFRHRSIAFGATLFGLFLIIVLLTALNPKKLDNFILLTLPFFVGATGLFLIGQALAVWVRKQAYSERKETLMLVAALLLGALISFSLSFVVNHANYYFFPVAEKTKLKLEEVRKSAESQVNAPVTAQLNSQARQPTSASPATPSVNEKSNASKIAIVVLQTLPTLAIVLYWGSAFDLWVFLRQRRRLVEAKREQELRRAQTARREAELRLSILVAQVEPHFLFNTLAGVRSAILTEPLRATAIVDHLVDYLRSTIPQMRSDGIIEQSCLSKQLEGATAYLKLMQARIPRLQFKVETEVEDIAFPPLLLITLVENAIKHGVEPKIGPAHISIKAQRIMHDGEAKIEVCVMDDGVGFKASNSGTGIGLVNIRERLASMYGSRAQLLLKARNEGGVAASLILPLETN